MAETEVKAVAVEAAAEETKPAKKPTTRKKKAAKPAVVTVKLVKSLSGRSDKQIATAQSLGLRKIGDTATQPDNAQTNGKLAKIAHLVAVTKA